MKQFNYTNKQHLEEYARETLKYQTYQKVLDAIKDKNFSEQEIERIKERVGAKIPSKRIIRFEIYKLKEEFDFSKPKHLNKFLRECKNCGFNIKFITDGRNQDKRTYAFTEELTDLHKELINLTDNFEITSADDKDNNNYLQGHKCYVPYDRYANFVDHISFFDVIEDNKDSKKQNILKYMVHCYSDKQEDHKTDVQDKIEKLKWMSLNFPVNDMLKSYYEPVSFHQNY